ncbi:MAG TPA: ATP-binding protein [Stellaceae bacterium]|nr:ATP-binding protein [Stellaceae bacterium]
MTGHDIITPIAAALDAAPDNHALRRHLVDLLIKEGRAGEALAHCALLLAITPDDPALLDWAAKAAESAGEGAKAAAYRRLLAALGGRADAPEPVPVVENKVVALRVVDGGREDGEDESEGLLERPRVTLADVGGLEHVKARLRLSFLEPLKNPQFRTMYGKSLRGGLLLYGPPGCGKTFIARATAGELAARFYGIGLTDVLDMWFGQSEQNLGKLFANARRHAPCVLFFDELDAIGQRRSQLRSSAMRSVVTVLLAELDGQASNNEGLFIMAATNHPWDVDSALKRPGRFDRTVLVLPPDRPARRAILDFHLRDRPLGDVDLDGLADRTEDFSGADLAHLCESATELAMSDAIKTGTARPLDQHHFKTALREIKPSTRTWFETAKSYAQYSNEGGLYDEVLTYLKNR